MANPFSLFDLPVDFSLDQAQLSARYLALQRSLHPDNFAQCSAQEQRLAMQKSAEINDALQLLKDPISRADCIIALALGEQEEQTNRDMAFLMQQMDWREQLEHIEQQQDLDELSAFSQQIDQSYQDILTQLSTALSAQQWQQARNLTDKLRFIKKLTADIERIEEDLTDF
ncbi:Fe-S protein assembly co-chaperone HscB [Caviibacterium pharyngocola]|uniref:Co-chaperone protein HscB homolog n=1 Tax=Caviibacterium pharyngocola TaxID=28159 RepID=A0A2M8RVT2_9PAST|nr:Fe-S protein assembly co-chaperone HscB [Caviibacterium pharyngocola]PJG82986.1 Fe-S protein assembly co-chaperone HscB [Caviibacterium pharyngocola]